MKYKVILLPRAEKALDKLSAKLRMEILIRIKRLEDDPRPPNVKKMKGRNNEWRIRYSKYRIVYEIHDDRLLVNIIEIDHRKDIYR